MLSKTFSWRYAFFFNSYQFAELGAKRDEQIDKILLKQFEEMTDEYSGMPLTSY